MEAEVTLHISVNSGTGYVFSLFEGRNIEDFEGALVQLDELNFYDNAIDDDVLLPIMSQSLVASFSAAHEPNSIELCFEGTVLVHMGKDDIKRFEQANSERGIDYSVASIQLQDGTVLEPDEDWEFVVNRNVTVQQVALTQ